MCDYEFTACFNGFINYRFGYVKGNKCRCDSGLRITDDETGIVIRFLECRWRNGFNICDDLPDYPVMMAVGVPVCPKDAAQEIKAISHYISDKDGGQGCVRDVLEQVLRAQGKWIDCEKMNWEMF